jgi:Tfp pilus assembly protein PilV
MHYPKLKFRKFTLVEILAAMAVFMIAIAPLMGLLMRTTQVHAENIKKIKSQMLVKSEMARLQQYEKNADFNNVNSDGSWKVAADTAHKTYNGLFYEVTANDNNSGTMPYNLVLFTIKVGYTKNNVDETYYLYVAKEE